MELIPIKQFVKNTSREIPDDEDFKEMVVLLQQHSSILQETWFLSIQFS